MERGDLVPDDVMVGLIGERVASDEAADGRVEPRVAAHQVEVETAEDHVQGEEHAEAEADRPLADRRRDGVLGLQEPVGDPGLAPGLLEDPAGEVREEREGDAGEGSALEPLRALELPAPQDQPSPEREQNDSVPR